MLAPSGELLRAGLELKLSHLRRAVRCYVCDRTNQAAGKATSFAVGIGLLALAGLLLLEAGLVALAALFQWVWVHYGIFWAFLADGLLLLLLAAVVGGIALATLKRSPREIPSLASRLRVAVASPPSSREMVGRAVSAAAATVPLAPLAPGDDESRAWLARNRGNLQFGLVLAAFSVLGLTALRRSRRTRRSES